MWSEPFLLPPSLYTHLIDSHFMKNCWMSCKVVPCEVSCWFETQDTSLSCCCFVFVWRNCVRFKVLFFVSHAPAFSFVFNAPMLKARIVMRQPKFSVAWIELAKKAAIYSMPLCHSTAHSTHSSAILQTFSAKLRTCTKQKSRKNRTKNKCNL